MAMGTLILLGLVGLVLLAWLIVIALEARKMGRTGWWLYIVCGIINPLNIIALILWYVRFRKQPLMAGGKPFM